MSIFYTNIIFLSYFVALRTMKMIFDGVWIAIGLCEVRVTMANNYPNF